MADWDPELYNRFRRYRAEPFATILARLAPGPDERIIDLGCGTGENTVDLARASAGGRVVGMDSSRAMIDRAIKLRATLGADLKSRVSFAIGDIGAFEADGAYTIIFSNAALQWVADHRGVLAACWRALRPGGRLVVQMPANDLETAQVAIHALAAEARWRAALGAVETPSRHRVRPPGEYSAMLSAIGYVGIDCHYHTFHHPMASPAEIVEWSRATALRPYLERIGSADEDEFLAELTARLETAYGTRGALTFTFRRLLLWASRLSQ
ncbi:MAG: methyltransferase domain-containing protein [Candidatus Binataceae bacterium]|nr:methyltransferase domain-containing protein [Candidatus Binataceae bacterium]